MGKLQAKNLRYELEVAKAKVRNISRQLKGNDPIIPVQEDLLALAKKANINVTLHSTRSEVNYANLKHFVTLLVSADAEKSDSVP